MQWSGEEATLVLAKNMRKVFGPVEEETSRLSSTRFCQPVNNRKAATVHDSNLPVGYDTNNEYIKARNFQGEPVHKHQPLTI